MKLIVLGATGGVGREIVKQALERGHSVTAFVRDPDRLKESGDRITVIRGDLLSCPELQDVIEGHDAVLSGFGARAPVARADADLLFRFAVALTGAMRHTTTRRVVVVSTAFLFKDSIMPPAYPVGRLFFPNTVADAAKMEDTIRKSGLDWTIVRPPRLTDRPGTRRYRVREGHLPVFGFTLSRADTADFMIRSVEDRAYIGKVAGVSY
jgi:putative NADH-flavin reductase